MRRAFRYGSVCSGIEAATVAWHSLGWQASFLSEIDPFARAVLKHHFAGIPLHGDFTTIGAEDYEPIDLLVGGTPCQSFSIAGLRGGLDDDRGNLALEYLRLADRLRTRWLVFENVPGLLSSNGGRDFGAFLGGLVELGYGFCYRVLDAQHFGIPQRRRRIFVVGYLGDWRRAAAVLLERHSLSGNPPPRRGTGEKPTQSLTTRFGNSGADLPDAEAGWLVAGTLDKAGDKGGTLQDARQGKLVPIEAYGGNNYSGPIDVATALKANHIGSGYRYDLESETFVAHTLRADGFDASEDGSNRGTPLVPVHVQEVADPITAHEGKTWTHEGSKNFRTRNVTAFDTTQITHPENRSNPPAIAGSAVRRLTPEECEQLQGFPVGFTHIPWRGGLAADGPRYKALGNSMAVPVMAWIGRRIQAVEDLD